MRVPHALLHDTISVADYSGSGAMGPVFGTARAVRASVQATGKLLTNAEGQVVSTVSRVVIRPEDGPVAVGSKVTFVGEHFRVVEAYPVPDARRPTQWELLLSRWATT